MTTEAKKIRRMFWDLGKKNMAKIVESKTCDRCHYSIVRKEECDEMFRIASIDENKQTRSFFVCADCLEEMKRNGELNEEWSVSEMPDYEWEVEDASWYYFNF